MTMARLSLITLVVVALSTQACCLIVNSGFATKDFALSGTDTQRHTYAVQIRDPATNGLLAVFYILSTETAPIVGDSG